MNVQFPAAFKADLILGALNSVYIVQECCYRACKNNEIHATQETMFSFPADLDAKKLVELGIQEQGARYSSFLTNFAAGFQDTQLEMYKWLLYPVVTATVDELEKGLSYRPWRMGLSRLGRKSRPASQGPFLVFHRYSAVMAVYAATGA